MWRRKRAFGRSQIAGPAYIHHGSAIVPHFHWPPLPQIELSDSNQHLVPFQPVEELPQHFWVSPQNHKLVLLFNALNWRIFIYRYWPCVVYVAVLFTWMYSWWVILPCRKVELKPAERNKDNHLPLKALRPADHKVQNKNLPEPKKFET
jgi:hypothetical protein